MKKIYFKILPLLIITLILCACSMTKEKEKDTNLLGGTGELHNTKYLTKMGAMYDDEAVYLLGKISQYTINESYIKVDKDNNAYVNCDLASCNHSDITCKAIAEEVYFRFGDEVYQIKIPFGNNMIKRGDTVVYRNSIPENLTDEMEDNEIQSYYVIDEEYLLIEGASLRYAKLLDKDFQVVYTYTDPGLYRCWGKVYEGTFYYISSIGQLTAVDLTTGDSKVVDIEGAKFSLVNDEEEYLFLSGSGRGLYRYSLATQEYIVYPDITAWEILVHDGYIYNSKFIDNEKWIQIWDEEGNLVFETDEYKNMHPEWAMIAHGKLYAFYDDMENGEKPMVAVMNADGTDYQEIEIDY